MWGQVKSENSSLLVTVRVSETHVLKLPRSEYYKRIEENWMYFDTSILCLQSAIFMPYCFSGFFSQSKTSTSNVVVCQAWCLSAAKGVEKSKSKIKNSRSKNWSSKGKIYKDPCLSHNENHGLKTFYASLHLKWLWRKPSASDQRHITWEQRWLYNYVLPVLFLTIIVFTLQLWLFLYAK